VAFLKTEKYSILLNYFKRKYYIVANKEEPKKAVQIFGRLFYFFKFYEIETV
jgi:hypothetical protein